MNAGQRTVQNSLQWQNQNIFECPVPKQRQPKGKDYKIVEGTELTVTNDIGAELVKAAQDARRKRFMEQSIGEVETVVSLIEQTEAKIREQQNRLRVYSARLDAIQSGNIVLGKNQTGQILIEYKDESLSFKTCGF